MNSSKTQLVVQYIYDTKKQTNEEFKMKTEYKLEKQKKKKKNLNLLSIFPNPETVQNVANRRN